MPSALDRIGVVGASGYVGERLTTSMVSEGGAPRLFGRRDGSAAGLPIQALTDDPEQFRGLDCVVHLSAITSSRASGDELRRVNIDLAVETARRAAAAGVGRLVFISSILVHGRAAAHTLSPNSLLNPDSAYGHSKAEAEVALTALAAESGLELAIVRPPMIYGTGCKGSFPLLAKLVGTGLPLPFAKARAPRSFCSIANAVSAIRHVIAQPTPPAVLLPADPEDFDTAGLVSAMAQAMGRKAVLWPAPKAMLAAPLALVGRREMIVSLFEPLRIERGHWRQSGWQPVESADQGVRAALAI